MKAKEVIVLVAMHYGGEDSVVATFASMTALEQYLEAKRSWYIVKHYPEQHRIVMNGSNKYYYHQIKHYEEEE